MKALYFLLLATLLVASGCERCQQTSAERMPATADGRVQAMANHLPVSTEYAFYVAEMEDGRETMRVVQERLSTFFPPAAAFQQQLQRQFGINILEAQSWKEAGIHPNSSFSVALNRSRVILMTYVEDRVAFEKLLTERAARAFEISATVRNETVGGQTMKIMSEDPARQIAWLYKGQLAIVVFPATTQLGAVTEGSASLILAEVANTRPDEGMGSTEGFARWKGFSKDWPITMFVNTRALFEDGAFQDLLAQAPDSATSWISENVDFVGVGAKASNAEASVRVQFGTNEAATTLSRSFVTPENKAGWDHFSTEHLLAGIRLNIDFPKVWAFFLETLSDDERRAMMREFRRTGEDIGIDLEEDVFTRLTGNAGFFFYGLAQGALAMIMTDPASALDKAGLILAVELKDKASLDGLIEKFEGPFAVFFREQPFLEGKSEGVRSFQVHEQIRLVTRDNLLLATTLAFSDEALLNYMDGKRSEKKLTAMEQMHLGKDFAAKETFSGIYLNLDRLRSNLGPALAMLQIIPDLSSYREAALEVSVDEGGPFAQLTINMVSDGD